MLALLALFGCPASDLGKTLVFALDEEPAPTLDRQTCGTGVGLALPLGLTQSLALDILDDGSAAFLATCALDDFGDVVTCGTLTPEVVLTFADGRITGENAVSVAFEGTDCSGATLENLWTMEVDELRLTGAVETVWRLDDSNACEDFEGEIMAAAGNGRGIDGCELDFALAGTMVARCDLRDGAFLCEDP